MDSGVLEKLFASPLLTRGEVGEENLEILSAACEKGLVGSRVFQEHKTKPTVYWLKTSLLNKGETTPTALKSKRKFISPLVGQRSNSPKRRKQTVSNVTPTLEERTDEGGDKDGVSEERKSSVVLTQANMLMKEKQSLQRQLEEKKEKLRKLNMVKMYRVKNNLEELQALVNTWRTASQEVAEELLTKSTRQPPPNMADLLLHLHIDPTLIHYSAHEEGFY